MLHIRDGTTFLPVDAAQVYDYALLEDATYSAQSTITVSSTVAVKYGDIVYLDDVGYLGIARGISDVGTDCISITADQALGIIDRELLRPAQSILDTAKTQGIEAFIAGRIAAEFTGNQDVLRRKAYLTAEAKSATKRTLWDLDLAYTLPDVVRKAWQSYGIRTIFSATNTGIGVTITTATGNLRIIDLSQPNIKVISDYRQDSTVGVVVCYCTENGASSTWYLLQDGTVTDTYTDAGRVSGVTTVVEASTEADITDAVAGALANNEYSQEIEIRAEPEALALEMYDRARVRTQSGEVLETYVSAIQRNMGQTAITYTLGNVRKKISIQVKRKER